MTESPSFPISDPSCTCTLSEGTEELVREMLVRIGDRWSLRVIETLGEEGSMRFTRLRERLDGVSQKMLTQTLRQLERDGLVERRVFAEVPPRVDYRLTPMGEQLSYALCGLWMWAERHLCDVQQARESFDRQTAQAPRETA
jgi:DNA-binding HxlR family transcriptional regulator